ncbi:DUF4349 domain-containing protein [Flavobacterium rhizosphaerae]|uniref:DUF4349 domain-containing protein n=1 Tax=Flavobacterium rhizosphaerae TaxID=3163298 RepID=A0ABW8YZV9_9FLAO
MKKLITALLIAVMIPACKKEAESEGNDSAYEASAETFKDKMALPTEAAPARDQKIIKTAFLRFETGSLDSTAAIINSAITRYNGLMQNDLQNKEYNSLTRSITVRLPSANFEKFIADISKGIPYFDKRSITADDVTEEYIDVEARMKAKKVLEERYFDMLRRANKVEDMLQIEKEISAIREEIEAAEGRLRYLASRVNMSTVNIDFYKITEDNEPPGESYTGKAWNSLASGFGWLSSFFLIVLNIWPIIVIFVVVYIMYRRKTRKRKDHG